MEQTNKLMMAPLELYTAADVEPKEVEWLWYPYIPFGKVTLIQGDAGDGKSTFALNLAAILTRGAQLPFSECRNEPMNVIYLNSEDDADDTVVPRFMKANGVRESLFFISEKIRQLNFADRRIREAIEETGARVCIIDPLASYLGSDVSMNLANEVRARFVPLIDTGKETGCAIIIIAHMNKAEGMSAKHRTNGSVDMVAAPRSLLTIGRPPDDVEPDHRIMAHSKSNLAPLGPSILFSVKDGVVQFLETTDITDDQIVGMTGTVRRKETKREIAVRELTKMLWMGPKPQKEIMVRMKEIGISQRTCELAKGDLSIVTRREGDHSVWVLEGGTIKLDESSDDNYATTQRDTPLLRGNCGAVRK